ncbi:MAG: hypothetical protein ACHQAZ_02440 [Gammaproteobacteria bacterium]|jgi:heme-degrading monooxygenase HmoA|nr:hypothetical protein [Gammaproteobacteria bacterium]
MTTDSKGSSRGQACVMREWRAEIRRALKQEYMAYVMATGIVEYRQTPGNLGASLSVRDLDAERSEMVTLSWWVSREAIVGFAGQDIDKAHYYPEDDRYLLTKPDGVQHYDSIVP